MGDLSINKNKLHAGISEKFGRYSIYPVPPLYLYLCLLEVSKPELAQCYVMCTTFLPPQSQRNLVLEESSSQDWQLQSEEII